MFNSITDLGLTRVSNSESFCPAHFAPVKCGQFFLSVQGSDYSYSHPRDSVAAEEYKAMEIALFDERNNWVKVYEDERFQGNEILEYFDTGGERPVAGYVPVEAIVAFANFLVKISSVSQMSFSF